MEPYCFFWLNFHVEVSNINIHSMFQQRTMKNMEKRHQYDYMPRRRNKAMKYFCSNYQFSGKIKSFLNCLVSRKIGRCFSRIEDIISTQSRTVKDGCVKEGKSIAFLPCKSDCGLPHTNQPNCPISLLFCSSFYFFLYLHL